MAEQDSQETDNAEGGAGGERKGGIVRLAGLAAGLFVLMSVSQLTTMVVASKFLPGVTPGAAVTEEEMAEDDEEVIDVAALDPPQYASLNQPLIVSYQSNDSIRFLQLTVEAMARDDESISAFTTHTPAIRNNLLTLFASLDLNELITVAGKEKARDAALAEVQTVLASTAPEATIEDVYFTSFVVQ